MSYGTKIIPNSMYIHYTRPRRIDKTTKEEVNIENNTKNNVDYTIDIKDNHIVNVYTTYGPDGRMKNNYGSK